LFLIVLSFSIVLFFAYILLSLNPEIVLVDFLFLEIPISLGMALLYFLILGSVITLLLEICMKIKKLKSSKKDN